MNNEQFDEARPGGLNTYRLLRRLQPWALWGVLYQPAFGLEFFAEQVGMFEVFGFPGGLPLLKQGTEFRRRLDVASATQAEDGVDLLPGRQGAGGLRRSQFAGREQPVRV